MRPWVGVALPVCLVAALVACGELGEDGCSDGIGHDSRLAALDARTGAEAWDRPVDHYRAGGRCEEGDVQGMLWAGGADQVVYEDSAHELWGFDPTTGREEQPDIATVDSTAAAAAVGLDGRRYEPVGEGAATHRRVAGEGDVIVAEEDSGRFAQLARTGPRNAWRVHLPEPQEEIVLAADPEVVVVAGGGHVVTLDSATGATRWRRPAPRRDVRPAVAGATVVLSVCEGAETSQVPTSASCGADGDLVGVDAATGEARWELPGLGEHVAAAAGDAVVTVEDATVRMRRAHDGELRWEARIPGDVEFYLLHVFAQPGEDGVLVALGPELRMLETGDGSVAWTYEVEGGGAGRVHEIQRFPSRIVVLHGSSDT